MNLPRCRHLRTKNLFTGMHPDQAFAEKEPDRASPTLCWCNLTQSPVGPDDSPVNPQACMPGRSCCEE